MIAEPAYDQLSYVHVYERTGKTDPWVFKSTLQSSDNAPTDMFGGAVAVKGKTMAGKFFSCTFFV